MDSDELAYAVPDWLSCSEDYTPTRDREGYLDRTLLSLASLLSYFRLNTKGMGRFSPSPLVKFVGALCIILLNSLSRNFVFTLVLLALVLLRVASLEWRALRMTAGVSSSAAILAFLIMLPAMLLGQTHSALLICIKTLVSTSLVMCVATTTPQSDISATLRLLRLPEMIITAFDLTIKSIISLGETALEIMTALKLRSVGHNRNKGRSLGGIGGMLFLKAKEEADSTYEAMLCRCYDPSARIMGERMFKTVDLAWFAGFCVVIAAFAYFQGVL